MDPTSFAIGVVSLAGLYSTCAECFRAFRKIQAFGEDFDTVVTKLEVEKTMFLQWGERVGFLATSLGKIDSRLYHPSTHASVSKVLICIEKLLTDTEQLQRRFGLTPDQKGSNKVDSVILSEPRMHRFKMAQRHERNSHALQRQRSVGFLRKFRWAIHDHEKFEKLVSELFYFVKRLHDLVPATQGTTERLILEDLKALREDVKKLRVVEKATAGRHKAWSAAASDMAEASQREWSTMSMNSGRTGRAEVSEQRSNMIEAWRRHTAAQARLPFDQRTGSKEAVRALPSPESPLLLEWTPRKANVEEVTELMFRHELRPNDSDYRSTSRYYRVT